MESFDLLIIGGGINGCAIARDAAIREAKVLLVEKDDLGACAGPASPALIHSRLSGPGRGEFRLARHALRERETLLRIAPHVVRPLRLVLPHVEGMPPWWKLRAGLLLHDLLAIRGSLPRTRMAGRDEQEPLRQKRHHTATFWDVSIDDPRLVVLNAVDAAERGAEIATRTELLSAKREGDVWRVTLSGGRTVEAKAIVNAAGSKVADVLRDRIGETGPSPLRPIKTSYIVVPQLTESEDGYILHEPDGGVVTVLPYGRFTLVGATDVPEDRVTAIREIDYLCAAVNRSFKRQIGAGDVVWSHSSIGLRHDDHAAQGQAFARGYHLELASGAGPKLLSVFGGTIGAARALAQEALDRLGVEGRRSSAFAALPGGDIYPAFLEYLDALSAWMPGALLQRLSRSYGTRLRELLNGAGAMKELGRNFGAGLHEAEVRYLRAHEFARTADDILWRRTKLGLLMSSRERKALASWLERQGPS